MSSRNKKLLIVVLGLVLLFIAVILISRFHGPADGHFEEAVHSAISDPKGFVKRQVNGGIGVALVMDNATGLPAVNTVLLGSPAEMAGLRKGDIITKVGDTPTAGKSLAQVVDSIRGYSLGSVDLTVRRGTTNLNFVIKRSSWNAIGQTNIFSPNTNPVPLLRLLPGSNAP